ncbi:MAG: hypothetical protein RIS92_1147 [Verrucomicrobiota bacterium]
MPRTASMFAASKWRSSGVRSCQGQRRIPGPPLPRTKRSCRSRTAAALDAISRGGRSCWSDKAARVAEAWPTCIICPCSRKADWTTLLTPTFFPAPSRPLYSAGMRARSGKVARSVSVCHPREGVWMNCQGPLGSAVRYFRRVGWKSMLNWNPRTESVGIRVAQRGSFVLARRSFSLRTSNASRRRPSRM